MSRSSSLLLEKSFEILTKAVITRGAEDIALLGGNISSYAEKVNHQINKFARIKHLVQENMGNLPKTISNKDIVDENTKSQVGGKAESSMRSLKMGGNVPEFFTVTADAYRELTTGLKYVIEKHFEVDYSGNYIGYDNRPTNMENNALKPIREWIISQEFSQPTTQEFRKQWAMLTVGKPENEWTELDRLKAENFSLAVRSTSLDEDGGTASFAGQQLSLINVKGFDNFIKAIKEVMASVYSFSAIQYRTQRGIDISDLAMPVMVQHAVPLNSGYAVYGFSQETGSDGFKWMKYNTVLGYGAGIADGFSRAKEIKINLSVHNDIQNYTIQPVEIIRGEGNIKKNIFAINNLTGEKILYRTEYHPDQLKIFVADTTIEGSVSSKDYVKGVEAPTGDTELDPVIMKEIEKELMNLQLKYGNIPQDAELGFEQYKILDGVKFWKNNKLERNDEGILVLKNDDTFDNIDAPVNYKMWNIQSRDITTNMKNENGIFPEKKPIIESPIIAEGRAGSEGIISGKVRLVPTVADALKLIKVYEDSKEIGITPFAEVDFANVFVTMDGYVVEVGSYTSHASIVARESLKPMIYDIPKLIKYYEISANTQEEAVSNAKQKLISSGFKESDFKHVIIKSIGNGKLGVIFSKFAEGQEITIDGYNGYIYNGLVHKLVDWQERKEIFENQALLDEMSKKPTEFKIGCNASTAAAAEKISQKGIKTNTLIRGEIWIANAELEIEDIYLKSKIMQYMLEQNWIDESYILHGKLKGIDPIAIIHLAKQIENKTFDNLETSQIFQAWVKSGANEIYNIEKYFTESTYRVSGNAPEGRKGIGSEIFRKNLEIQGKTSYNQGVAVNREYPESVIMEFAMLKVKKTILETNGIKVKQKVMPQFVRTYEELSYWLDFAYKYGINEENGFIMGSMIEVPMNVIDTDYNYSDLERMLRDPRIKFISVGTNDLSSLSMAYDRSESKASEKYPANLPQFVQILRKISQTAKKYNKQASICGEIISTYPDMAEFIIESGFTSSAVSNSVVSVRSAYQSAQEVERRLNIFGKRIPNKKFRVRSNR